MERNKSLPYLSIWFVLLTASLLAASFNVREGKTQASDEAALFTGAPVCSLVVMIYGGGRVDVQTPDGFIRLERVQNDLRLDCGVQVTLTAVPRERWRFVGWQYPGQAAPIPSRSFNLLADETFTATFELEGLIITQLDEPIIGRDGRLATQIANLDPDWQPAPRPQQDAALNAPPVITVWYGDNQIFGQLGTPQRWVNILGNVSDPDENLSTLSYRLNGGPTRALNLGPDGRRLLSVGDFNIDLNRDELIHGVNQVVITARDTQNAEDVRTVSFTYNHDAIWPLPYSVDWAFVDRIQASSQVVDGLWEVSNRGLRPVVMGYDRIVAIGDLQWADYEITVPVTVHDIDPAGYSPISYVPAVGVVLRWEGHTDTPVVCSQPKCGYLPIGIAAWYHWEVDDEGFLLWVDNPWPTQDSSVKMIFDKTYLWKVRAETPENPDQKGIYKLKVWEEGQPEPVEWLLTQNTGAKGLRNGSLLLLAHHVDVTFGDASVRPLSDNIRPTLNVGVVGNGRVLIEPDKPIYDYGEVVRLTAVPDPDYMLGAWSGDLSGNSNPVIVNMTRDLNITATFVDARNPRSDDFNRCVLDNGRWTAFDPLGDSSFTMTDTQLLISIPEGVSHDLWQDANSNENNAPRLLTPADNLDFEVEVRFESRVQEKFQMQGILVQQDSNNLLRFDFHHDGANVRLFAARFVNGIATPIYNEIVPDGPTPHLRVRRQGDQWTQFYSYDGMTWTRGAQFNHALVVSAAGLFAGNSGDNPPAFDAVIDYFFNTAQPIVPEDGLPLRLPVSVEGSGGVIKSAECGNPITLTAVPDPNWEFVEWRGSTIDGLTNPTVSVAFDFDDMVTAVFQEIFYALDVEIVSNGQGIGGAVTLDPPGGLYTSGTVVMLTATPLTGWHFEGWTGVSGNPSEPITQITIDGDMAVKAVFTQDEYTLSVAVSGQGTVQRFPDKTTYYYGEEVQLIARPAAGWRFMHWTGAIADTAPIIRFTVVEDTAVEAVFEAEMQMLYMPVMVNDR